MVNITNSLLSGIAPTLKARLDVPVVCALQGEDGFVQMMPDPYRSQSQALMRRNSQAIDLFISPGEGYADRMSEFLLVPRDRIRVVHAGIKLPVTDDHAFGTETGAQLAAENPIARCLIKPVHCADRLLTPSIIECGARVQAALITRHAKNITSFSNSTHIRPLCPSLVTEHVAPVNGQ